MANPPVKRALISVANKSGIVNFGKVLVQLGVELISTGGTSKLLAGEGILHTRVEELTGLPEMLDGRVKTLHPLIHAGILGRRDTHSEEIKRLQVPWIDLVVVNFYPFDTDVQSDMDEKSAIELIDIGGPTLVRAAAKNFAWVSVVVDPQDYSGVLDKLQSQQSLSLQERRHLATKAFAATARYDAVIERYFAQHTSAADECSASGALAAREAALNEPPPHIPLSLHKVLDLRYGENPHQTAGAYQINHQTESTGGLLQATLIQGKPLSYNNLLDAESAWDCVNEFKNEPACVIVKHNNPCGAALGVDLLTAFQTAYAADALSAFGGIIALNQPCTAEVAKAIINLFAEVVIAPAFTTEAQELFTSKPNVRLLATPNNSQPRKEQNWDIKSINGGFLLQQKDEISLSSAELNVVTEAEPTPELIDEMLFAWRVIKYVKSNAILISENKRTLGIGAGQVSRVDAVDLALKKAGLAFEGAVLASDAFFPFRDSIDLIAKTNKIRAIIQPGGSKRDEEVIAACNEHKIAMVFTGKRCFRH